MLEKTAVVMMSCFNGEKFIRTQIESILGQTYSNLILLVRDDGSSDRTLSILEEFLSIDDRVYFMRDDLGNLGARDSFAQLMKYAALHYQNCIFFFSDQDDFWYENKIEEEMKLFSSKDKCKLVYTNYDIADADLNFIKTAYFDQNYEPKDYFRYIIMQNWLMGCTMALNYQLLSRCLNIPFSAENHDQHVATIASIIGEIVYIEKPLIKHRIHDENVTTSKSTSKFRNRIGRIVKDFKSRKAILEKFYMYAQSVRKSVQLYASEDLIDMLNKYIEMISLRGRRGVKIMKTYKFSMQTCIRNRLFILQLLFSGSING